MRAAFVTTLDNPFNYFTQYDDWYAFDTQKGYNTCAYVARVADTYPSMSVVEEEAAINDAVDEILRLNLTGNYIKVVDKDDEDNELPDFDEAEEAEEDNKDDSDDDENEDESKEELKRNKKDENEAGKS